MKSTIADFTRGVSKSPRKPEAPGSGSGTWSNSRDIDTANRQGPQKRVTGPTSYANFTISKGKGKR